MDLVVLRLSLSTRSSMVRERNIFSDSTAIRSNLELG
jgi:hypothetical protein